jgi:hypothetical protein
MYFALPMLLAFVQDADPAAGAKKSVQVTAKILVTKNVPLFDNAKPAPALVEDHVATSIVILESPVVVGMAIKNGKLDKLKSLAGGDELEKIMESLSIGRDAKAPNVIVLTYSGADAKDGVEVVKAMLDAFQQFLDGRSRFSADKNFELIINAKDQSHAELLRAQTEYDEFRRSATIFRTPKGRDISYERMAALEAKVGEVQIKRLEFASRLSWAELAHNEGRESLVVKANEWATRSGYFKLNGKNGNPLTAYMQSLKAEIEELGITEKLLRDSMKELAQALNEHFSLEMKESQLRNDIIRHEKLYDETARMVNQWLSSRDAVGYTVTVLSPPRATKQSRP